MKNYFPPQNQNFRYLQTNRSNRLGSLWSSFNLDFQSKLGTLRLANKLVINTSSTDDADLGRPGAFAHWYTKWWAICGSGIFQTADELLTGGFTQFSNPYGFTIGLADSQFDVTNPSGTTFRYTWDGTGTDPGITTLTVPVGTTVKISIGSGFASGNEGSFTVTGSGANYFEVTNASGVVESDKTIGVSRYIAVTTGTYTTSINPDVSDLKVFNGRLWLSTTYGLYSLSFDNANEPWILRVKFGSATSSHKLAYSRARQRLYFQTSAKTVGSIDTGDVVSNSASDDFTLELDSQNLSGRRITTLEAVGDNVIVGTQIENVNSIFGSQIRGSIIHWDGFSATYTEYEIDAGACLAICSSGNDIYAIDSEARILKYSGYSYVEIGRLPVDRILLVDATTETIFGTSPANGRFIHFNGMKPTKNNSLLFAINNLNSDAASSINENLPSGIWEFDLATNNFTHKYSFTLKTKNSATITDFGQNRILGIGALEINYIGYNSSLGRPTLMAGASYYTTASSTASAIFIDSPAKPDTDNEGQKRGYVVTSWFESNEITDNWTRLWATFRRFLNSADKIILKYRLDEEAPIEATITWTSTTTFTTTTDVSAYAGYEVEILQGAGSGSCNQITTVTFSSPNYTVTLDTAVTGVSGTAKARFQKWIKLGEISGQVLSYGSFPITLPNTRIQIKCCMEFTGDDEFHKIILVSNDDLKAIA